MNREGIYVGQKVWIKPNPLDRGLYPDGTDYWPTEITYVGAKLFRVKELVRADRTNYLIESLTENNKTNYQAEILLSLDGVLEFDRKEQLIIKIRKHFNSRDVYQEEDDKLRQIIEILEL